MTFGLQGVDFQASPSLYNLFVFRVQPLLASQNASLEARSYGLWAASQFGFKAGATLRTTRTRGDYEEMMRAGGVPH